jgi:autotransporter-associated beta strand protein
MKSPSKSLHRSLLLAGLAATPFVLFGPLQGATFNWTGAVSGTWAPASGNWDTTATFNNVADLSFNTVTNGSMFLGFSRTVRSLSFGSNIDSAVGVSFNGNNTTPYNLTFLADAGNASVNVDSGSTGAITLGNVTGVGTSYGAVILSSNLDVVHNGTGVLTFNRGIQGTGFSITKSGTGTMALASIGASPNTFTGDINVNAGKLIANGFVVATDMNNAAKVKLGGGTLEVSSVSGNNKDYTTVGFEVSSASTLIYKNLSSTTYTLTFSGSSLFALNADLTVQNSSTNTAVVNPMNFSRAITGAGDMVVETYNNIAASSDNYSLGRVLLTGDNSGWSGDIVISAGTVSLGGTATTGVSAGTGAIVIGATSSAVGAGLTFFSTATNGTTVAYGNNVTVNAGGFRSIKGGGTDHNMLLSGSITLNGNLNVDHTLNGGTFDRSIHLSGNITGAGGLDITRTGTTANTSLVLTGTNNYSGGTSISSAATLSVGNGGTTGSITGNVVNSGALIVNRSNDLSFSGNISGAGVFSKLGAGNLTLGGTNSFSGGTTVSAGGLIVDGSLSNAANAVGVSSGAALGGDGSIAGSVSFASGANFIFSTTATLDVTGSVSFGGFSTSNLIGLSGSTPAGVYTLLNSIGGSISQVNVSNIGVGNAADLGGGKLAYFDFTNGDLALNVSAVPEPGAFALLGGMVALGFVGTRRRRSS